MSNPEKNMPAYKDPNLPVEERVTDLLARMTLKEKVRQLDQYQGELFIDKTHPMMHTVMSYDAKVNYENMERIIGDIGIGCIHDLYAEARINNELQKYAVERTRLGIPILFAEEALHGLNKPGSTVFPHAISQASTFDPEIVRKIGRCIAAETRSLGIHETFSPVLDLAREPRWGRVEETYGEDTYLASRMGVAMVRGLEGDSLRSNDSIIAEPKHFAVHGIPEGGLNTSPCSVGERDLFTYYLPVFEAAFKEGGAVNVMCSYNSIDGVPCPADRRLLTDILRGKWGMPGFVRSDLGAIRRLQDAHRTAASPADAIRQALEAGTDMQYYDYPHELYQEAIIQMVEAGIIPMEVVDRAAARVLRVKFMLGLFENPYADTGLAKKTIRCKAHLDVSLQAAREAICLLKNDNGLLPLSKNIGKIAVIGPSADTARLGDYVPYIEGFEPVTLLEGIRKIVSPQTEVCFTRGTGILDSELYAIPAKYLKDDKGAQGLHADYFNNADFSGEPAVSRTDAGIDFNWILAVPDSRVTASQFTVRWQGRLCADRNFSGYIGFSTQDSVRLWIDGKLIVDAWDHSRAPKSVPYTLEAGREYAIKIEYRRDVNGRQVMLGWNEGRDAIDDAVALAKQADVVILAVGDSQKTCGEGVDRSSLDLPGSQPELVRAVCAAGRPVVLVLQNGRPVTFGGLEKQVSAIIEAWYPGDQGGTAIAEVLFGDYNPAGRLPISFPKTIGQIPVYYNRRRGGSRHYIDQDNKPLYAFGYGLSYTTFSYQNLSITPNPAGRNARITVSFDVTNTGDRAGDEVPQLYISDPVCSVVRPEKELRRFSRIHLKPGETARVVYELEPKDLAVMNRDYEWVVEPGRFIVTVGPSSDSAALTGEFEVI